MVRRAKASMRGSACAPLAEIRGKSSGKRENVRNACAVQTAADVRVAGRRITAGHGDVFRTHLFRDVLHLAITFRHVGRQRDACALLRLNAAPRWARRGRKSRCLDASKSLANRAFVKGVQSRLAESPRGLRYLRPRRSHARRSETLGGLRRRDAPCAFSSVRRRPQIPSPRLAAPTTFESRCFTLFEVFTLDGGFQRCMEFSTFLY